MHCVCLFAAFNLLAAGLILLLFPETKQQSLEELDLIFAVLIKRFCGYQVKEVLQWCVRRFVIGRDVILRDLYMERIQEGQQMGEFTREGVYRRMERSYHDVLRDPSELSIGSSVGTHY